MVGDQLDKAPYLCERGDPECFEQVPLANAEYEAVRAHPARFLVVPGHAGLTAGEVVVEKRGKEAELVKRTDPRASS